MGMFRDSDCLEADVIKEMAEGLGSTGIRLEQILEALDAAREEVERLQAHYSSNAYGTEKPPISVINESIKEHNLLVDKAEDTLRWLLIQREACGFRTHRNVDTHYPIPGRIKFLKP